MRPLILSALLLGVLALSACDWGKANAGTYPADTTPSFGFIGSTTIASNPVATPATFTGTWSLPGKDTLLTLLPNGTVSSADDPTLLSGTYSGTTTATGSFAMTLTYATAVLSYTELSTEVPPLSGASLFSLTLNAAGASTPVVMTQSSAVITFGAPDLMNWQWVLSPNPGTGSLQFNQDGTVSNPGDADFLTGTYTLSSAGAFSAALSYDGTEASGATSAALAGTLNLSQNVVTGLSATAPFTLQKTTTPVVITANN